jgi:hypothetical protein
MGMDFTATRTLAWGITDLDLAGRVILSSGAMDSAPAMDGAADSGWDTGSVAVMEFLAAAM